MPKMSTVYDSLFCRVTRFFIHAVQGDCIFHHSSVLPARKPLMSVWIV